MGEKVKMTLAYCGSLYDFEPYRGVDVKENPSSRYFATAFDYISDGFKSTAREIEETREGKPEQLELISKK